MHFHRGICRKKYTDLSMMRKLVFIIIIPRISCLQVLSYLLDFSIYTFFTSQPKLCPINVNVFFRLPIVTAAIDELCKLTNGSLSIVIYLRLLKIPITKRMLHVGANNRNPFSIAILVNDFNEDCLKSNKHAATIIKWSVKLVFYRTINLIIAF